MKTSPLSRVIQHLLTDRQPDGGEITDAELLTRFLRTGDEDALATLVRRHAPMVWGVCRRLLNHHDAEDAFQATFLVLIRKAADVPRLAVANWLYGVARQTAVRLRAMAAKRGRRETQVVNMPEPTVSEVRDADLQRVVDEELSRLPDHYRSVIVLCDLEGATRKQAARHLGIPEGSVASRLARARVMVAKRLAQRGVVMSGASVSAVLTAGSASASAPPALVASTIKAASLLAAGQATGVVSATVAALTEGMVKSMFVAKIKTVVSMVLIIATLAGAAGLIYQTHAAGLPEAKEEQFFAKQDQNKGEVAPKAQQEQPGGPGPAGAAPKKDQEQAKDQTLKLEEPVQSMRWSRDGTVMASLSTRAAEVGGKKVTLSTFRVRDARTGKLKVNLGELEYPGLGTFDLSSDGKFLAISSRLGIAAGDRVEVYDTEKGTPLTTIEMEYGRSRVWFAFSPDNRTLAVCGFEPKEGKLVGTVRLFDTKKGELKQRLFTHGGSTVLSVLFSPDGKSLAAGCHQGEITVWDVPTGKIKTKLDASGPIAALAWSPDSKLLAAGGIEGGRIWDLATGKSRELKIPVTPPNLQEGGADGSTRISDFVFSPDGRYIAGEGALVKKDDQWKFRILVLDTATGDLRHEWLSSRGFGFTPNSKRLAILQDPKTVKRMDLEQEVSPKGDAAPQKPGEEKQPMTKEEKLKSLVGKVLAAHGGEDKLSELRFAMTVKHSNGETQHYFVQPPRNFRWETTHPDRTGKRIVIHFPEGRRWWGKEPNGEAKEFFLTGIEPPMEYWHDNVKFFGPRQVLRLKDADHKVALLDEVAKIGDRAAIGVEVTGPYFKGKMYFDKETHLLVKRTADRYYRSQGFILYSDYKKFDGVPIAQKEDDGHYMPQVTDFKVADKFDARLFSDPNSMWIPPVTKKLDRVPDPAPDLKRELARLDVKYRHGTAEQFAELEKQAESLVKQFPDREDQARIWGQVAHVAGQSGIDRHADLVRRYATKCLAGSRDPLQRGRMHSLLASAVDLTGGAFAKGRKEAAEILLAGYREMLTQDLPETAPELPAVEKIGELSGRGDAEEAQARARRAAQLAARQEAQFIHEQVARRDTLVQQLRDLYKPDAKRHGRTAEGLDELRVLAAKVLTEQHVGVLMKRVTE